MVGWRLKTANEAPASFLATVQDRAPALLPMRGLFGVDGERGHAGLLRLSGFVCMHHCKSPHEQPIAFGAPTLELVGA